MTDSTEGTNPPEETGGAFSAATGEPDPVPEEYVAPAEEYVAPAEEYVAPAQEYVAPAQEYVAPPQEYVAPPQEYVAPPQEYAAPSAPAQQYAAAPQQYAAAPQQYASIPQGYAATPGGAPQPRVGQRKTFVLRGVLWGIMLGLGLAIVAVLTTTIPLDLVQMIIVFVAGVAAGTLWSLFGPAKK